MSRRTVSAGEQRGIRAAFKPPAYGELDLAEILIRLLGRVRAGKLAALWIDEGKLSYREVGDGPEGRHFLSWRAAAGLTGVIHRPRPQAVVRKTLVKVRGAA